MPRVRPWALLGWGLGLIALGVAWAALAPAALLGSTTYLSTYGTSMLPSYHAGDLVAVRPADTYQVGDVVAYHNRLLNGDIVLHRVVAFDGTRLVTKGDNNPFADEYHALPVDVVGKEWIHLGAAGGLLGQLRSSENAGVVFGVAGLFAAGVPTALGNWITGQRNRRRAKRDKRRRPTVPKAAPAALVTAAGGLLAIAALGAIASFGLYAYAEGQPTTRLSGQDVAYSEAGSYSVTGSAPKGAVYPDGTFGSGDPVFLALTHTIHLGFTYVLASAQPVAVSGTASLSATIESSNTGWKRTITVVPATAFKGRTTSLAADIDVASILSLAQQYDRAVGLRNDLFALTFTADVKTTGSVADVPVTNEIAPRLPYHLDPMVMRLAAEGLPDVGASGVWTPAGGNPSTTDARITAFLKPAVNRQVVKHVIEPARLSALGVSATVADARHNAIVALVIFGVETVAFLALLVFALSARDEPSRIERRYGSQLVPVGRIAAIRNSSAVQVTSMASLARLAEHYDRMILHEHQGGEHWYAVQDGDLFYFYRTLIGRHEGLPPSDAAPEKSAALQPGEVR